MKVNPNRKGIFEFSRAAENAKHNSNINKAESNQSFKLKQPHLSFNLKKPQREIIISKRLRSTHL